jgi:signal peptidase I
MTIPGIGMARGKRDKLWEWTKSIVLAVLLALGIRTAVVEAFVIPSGSMEPTLQIGDRVLGNNRNLSSDSHIWGFVPHRALKAKAFARYWPLDRIGLLE